MKFEFSKIIMFLVGAVTLYVTVFTIDFVRTSGDSAPLAYLIPAVFGAFATAAGFYYSKAKVENAIKLRKKYGSEIYNDVKGESHYE